MTEIEMVNIKDMKNAVSNDNDEQKENNSFRNIFLSSFFTIVILIISVSYGVTWVVLFIVYLKNTESENLPSVCDALIKWDKVLIIIQLITTSLHFISSIIQLFNSAQGEETADSIVRYITTCRSCINYIAGIVILLAINITYFKIEDASQCGNIGVLNLVYIIIEWCLVGFFICFVIVLCTFAVISKKMKDQLE